MTAHSARSGVRCPNPEPHEPHQYAVRADGITVAGGLCDPSQWPGPRETGASDRRAVLLTKRERNVVAYALLHYAQALDAEDAEAGGYDGPLETADDCRLLSDRVRDA